LDILVALRKLDELEGEVGKLYEWLSTLFPREAKLVEFFGKLSADEQTHVDLVKYQERVARKTPRDFAAVDVDMQAIDKVLGQIAEFRKTGPSPRDAIRFALDIETEVAEYYAATIMDQSNKQFAELMKGLTADQKENHYKQLIQFAKDYE